MKCPECKSASGVFDSRPIDDGLAIRRRRRCYECGFRFTSFEITPGPGLFMVVERAGGGGACADAGANVGSYLRRLDPATLAARLSEAATEALRSFGREHTDADPE